MCVEKKEKIGFTDCHLFSKNCRYIGKNKKNDDDDRTEGAHKKKPKIYDLHVFMVSCGRSGDTCQT